MGFSEAQFSFQVSLFKLKNWYDFCFLPWAVYSLFAPPDSLVALLFVVLGPPITGINRPPLPPTFGWIRPWVVIPQRGQITHLFGHTLSASLYQTALVGFLLPAVDHPRSLRPRSGKGALL